MRTCQSLRIRACFHWSTSCVVPQGVIGAVDDRRAFFARLCPLINTYGFIVHRRARCREHVDLARPKVFFSSCHHPYQSASLRTSAKWGGLMR